MLANRRPRVQIATLHVCLVLVRPVVNLYVVRRVKLVTLHRKLDECTQVKSLDAISRNDRLFQLYVGLASLLEVGYNHLDVHLPPGRVIRQ